MERITFGKGFAHDMNRIAIYDMDKTITFRGTYTRFLIHICRATAPWRLLLAPLVPLTLAAFALRLIDRTTLKEWNQWLMLGGRISRAKLAPHLESYADHVMAHNLRAGAVARIAEDRRDGYRLVMATASYRLYVEPIARRLGFDTVIATDHMMQGLDYVRAKVGGENCYDMGKLRMIQAWMAEQGMDRAKTRIRAYSDHVSDAPMLSFADEPHAANPGPALAKLAIARGWPRVDWH